MTGGDETDSASSGKGSADVRGFLDALESLGRLPSELREPPPDLPFHLAPLDRLDLLEPGGGALAIWIIDRLHSGDLVAYGRPVGGGGFRISAVPTAAWPDLAINWSSGQAERQVVTSRWTSAAWSALQVPAEGLLGSPPPEPEPSTLPVVLGDAVALAQRWRERLLIPDGYPWPEAEFWKANPERRPDRGEAAAALGAAIRAGELTAVWDEAGEWRSLPASAWDASPDRADMLQGRLNVGDVRAELVATEWASLGLGRGERWRLAFLPLRGLLDWCEAKWGLQPAPAEPSAPACGGPAEGQVKPPAGVEVADPVAAKGKGGAPRRYDWDKLGAAFGAWLHDEPGRDLLAPTEHLAALHTLCDLLGSPQPERQTAAPYLTRWLKAYRIFNAGN